MKELKSTNRFLRDLKLARKRGKDLRKIEAIIDAVVHSQPLEPKHRMHRLQGDMKGLW